MHVKVTKKSYFFLSESFEIGCRLELGHVVIELRLFNHVLCLCKRLKVGIQVQGDCFLLDQDSWVVSHLWRRLPHPGRVHLGGDLSDV